MPVALDQQLRPVRIGGRSLPLVGKARIYVCGGGARLPQITEALAGDAWWRRLPFSRRPEVRALGPEDVAGIRDASGLLVSRQDVTPMALAHQGLILDAQANAVDRAMRGAVRAMDL